MKPQLLSKSTLHELKAKETLREQQEGLKLAKRVDNLRELAAKTETDYKKFETAALADIQEKINAKQKEFDELSNRYTSLKVQYDGMLPDMVTDREELDAFSKKLSKEALQLEKKKEKLSLYELDIAETVKKTKESLKKQKDLEKRAEKIVNQATELQDSANTRLEEVKIKEEKYWQYVTETEERLGLRELNVKRREGDVFSRELAVSDREKEVQKKNIQVEDMRGTLQRSLDRLRANRTP